MYHIKDLIIKGFWGIHDLHLPLYDDINIIIGKNGTGKTTLMNLISAALSADVRTLNAIEFRTIEINLKRDRSSRKIKITKTVSDDLVATEIVYKIGTKTVTFGGRHFDRRFSRGPMLESLKRHVRTLLRDIVRSSSINVHRQLAERIPPGPDKGEDEIETAPIDKRLRYLLERLTNYQLRLLGQSNAVLSELQNEILKLNLFSKEMDAFDISRAKGTQINEEELVIAYKELQLYTDDTKNRIEDHVKVLKRCIKAAEEFDSSRSINISDVMPLPLLRRTQKVIALTLTAQKKKQEIREPITAYVDVLKSFIKDKEVRITLEQSPQFVIISGAQKGHEIPIHSLSSGEKQIMLLLTETLLQEKSPITFLADEPELSLHIEWQEILLASIRRLNPNAQIIVATHSPEVAGRHSDKILDMETLVNG